MSSFSDSFSGFSNARQTIIRSSATGLRRGLGLIDIPDREGVDALTVIDSSEVDPAEAGLDSAGIEQIWDAIRSLYSTGTQPAITLALRRHGKLALHRGIGHAKLPGAPSAYRLSSAGLPIGLDTPICIFSASKAVTAALIHKLADDGRIRLDDPVSLYRPEFAQHGKQNITINQVLSHRAGIPGLPKDLPIESLYDDGLIWDLLCSAKPISVDGGKVAYHAITGGFVMAKVLEKVTGDTIQNYLNEHIGEPMGMTHFKYGLAKEYYGSEADNVAAGPQAFFPLSLIVKRALGASFKEAAEISNTTPWHNAVIPAGNIYATAEECSRFFQMLLQDGRWEGKEILSVAAVNNLRRSHGRCRLDRTMLIPMRYSSGLMLGAEPAGLYGPHTGKAYGHLGLINKFCWADPERDISVSLLTTGLNLVSHHVIPLANVLRRISNVCR